MSYNCELIDVQYEKIAFVYVKTPQSMLSKTVFEAYNNILNFLKVNKINSIGNPYVVHYKMGIQYMEMGVGVPVDKEFTGQNEIQFKDGLKEKFVSCDFKGKYDEIEKAYENIMMYSHTNNIEFSEETYEVFKSGIENILENDLDMQIMMPVIRILDKVTKI